MAKSLTVSESLRRFPLSGGPAQASIYWSHCLEYCAVSFENFADMLRAQSIDLETAELLSAGI